MRIQPDKFLRLSREYAQTAAGWGRLAAQAMTDQRQDRTGEAVSAARAAWRNALDAQAAKEGRLYE